MKTASICTIGDEILIGQIVDTNSSAIARELQDIGVQVKYMISIADDRQQIVSHLANCLNNTDIVIVTGGLGPTKDDITKDALKGLSGSNGYVESAQQMAHVERILKARGIQMLDINKAQASVPDKCTVMPNSLGTAPGMIFRNMGINKTSVLYSLPGVPFEALGLLPQVIEDIKLHSTLSPISHRTILTFGIAESELAKKIEAWEENLPDGVHLAYLPNATLGVRLRLSKFGDRSDFEPQVEELRKILGNVIYGEGDENLQTVIGRMLAQKGKTVSAAESCTGGRISELFTSVAGCSEYYKGSVTSYANEVKMNILGVRKETLDNFGAVSEQTVIEMAAGVINVLNTDYSVVTSGIAGPGGGSPEKPVGTAWLAAAYRDDNGEINISTKKVQFASNRATNIERFASNALNLLRHKILETY